MRAIAIMVIVLGAIFASGCMSNTSNTTTVPVNESATIKGPAQANESAASQASALRYVQIQLTDGSKVGGQYVSESPAFVTIIPMYLLQEHTWENSTCRYYETDPEYLTEGSGINTAVKIALINLMIDIPDPRPFIEMKLKSQEGKSATIDRECEAQQEAYRIAREKREAEAAKYQGKSPQKLNRTF